LREAVAADVAADLHAAYLQGRPLEVVLGVTSEHFAEQVARENGWLVPWPMYGRMLTSAALGAAGAIAAGIVLVLPATLGIVAAVGWVLLWAGVDLGSQVTASGQTYWYAPIVYAIYTLFGMGFVAAVLAAVRRGLKAAVELRRTLRAGLVLLTVSAAISLPLALAIGHASDYSNAPFVVAAEFSLVLGLASVALVAPRAWALRVPS